MPCTGRRPSGPGTKIDTRRSTRSSAAWSSLSWTPEWAGYSTVTVSLNWEKSRSASMSRAFSGNQIGPRQLEFPPNNALVDSAGS